MQQVQPKSGIGGLVAIVVVAGIVLFLAISVAGPGSHFGNAWNYLAGSNQAPASGPSIVGSPTISADFINQVLAKYGSPAAGTGQDLYSLGQQYNVDPAFALAIFWNESNFGKAGMASSTLSLGNLRCIPSAACWNGYAAFSSWSDGYSAFYKLISGPLYVGSGLNTPESIIPRYAPSGDGNSPSHYINVVNSAMALWRAGKVTVP
jgi:hypothetical protein